MKLITSTGHFLQNKDACKILDRPWRNRCDVKVQNNTSIFKVISLHFFPPILYLQMLFSFWWTHPNYGLRFIPLEIELELINWIWKAWSEFISFENVFYLLENSTVFILQIKNGWIIILGELSIWQLCLFDPATYIFLLRALKPLSLSFCLSCSPCKLCYRALDSHTSPITVAGFPPVKCPTPSHPN